MQSLDNGAPFVIGGVSLPFVVYLLVLAGKYVDLIKTGQQARIANIILSLVTGGLWVFVKLYPEYNTIVGYVLMAVIGSLGSALVHKTVEKHNGQGKT